jgi:hypothetical protein
LHTPYSILQTLAPSLEDTIAAFNSELLMQSGEPEEGCIKIVNATIAFLCRSDEAAKRRTNARIQACIVLQSFADVVSVVPLIRMLGSDKPIAMVTSSFGTHPQLECEVLKVLNLLFEANVSSPSSRSGTLKRMNTMRVLDQLLVVAERNAAATAAALQLASRLCQHFDMRSHTVDTGLDTFAQLLSTRPESTEKVLECVTRLFRACKISPEAKMVGTFVRPQGNVLVTWLIGALRSKWSDASCAALTELASISAETLDRLCDMGVLRSIIDAMTQQQITGSLCSLAAVVLAGICGTDDSLRPGVLILSPAAASGSSNGPSVTASEATSSLSQQAGRASADAETVERPRVVAADLFDGTLLLREAESGVGSIVARSLLESSTSLVAAGSRICFQKPAQIIPPFLVQSSAPKAPTSVESTVERVLLSGSLMVLLDDATRLEKRPTNIQVLANRKLKSTVPLSLRSDVTCELLSAILRSSQCADGAALSADVQQGLLQALAVLVDGLRIHHLTYITDDLVKAGEQMVDVAWKALNENSRPSL